MRDISLRALDVLAAADIIAAEDTRNTTNLLKHYGITAKRLLTLHQHNERGAAEKIITLMAQGLSVALVTDAGTPAVSDPGALLVAAVHKAGYRAIPLPGANAALAALSVSGAFAPHFLFFGFLPNKSAARCRELQNLVALPYLLIFYEAPHRILECITDLQTVFGGERQIVIAREITKLFETIHSCTLKEASDWLNANANNQRGEFVLLLSGAQQQQEEINIETGRLLQILLKELPLKQAVQIAAEVSVSGRNKLYEMALQLARQKE